jgi:hypothetical protein
MIKMIKINLISANFWRSSVNACRNLVDRRFQFGKRWRRVMSYSVHLHWLDNVGAMQLTFRTWHIGVITISDFLFFSEMYLESKVIKIRLCPQAGQLSVRHWPFNDDT